jgi:hypothetical protein
LTASAGDIIDVILQGRRQQSLDQAGGDRRKIDALEITRVLDVDFLEGALAQLSHKPTNPFGQVEVGTDLVEQFTGD